MGLRGNHFSYLLNNHDYLLPPRFTILSMAIKSLRSPLRQCNANMLGPSESALRGLGWTSMNIASQPAAMAQRERSGIYSLCPPEAVPSPPGCWTLCVASKITGYPVRSEEHTSEL